MTDHRQRQFARTNAQAPSDEDAHARALRHAERALPDPIAIKDYTALGGFWVQPCNGGPYLGPSWHAYNLPVNERLVNVVLGRGYINNGERRTVDQWLDFSVEDSHDVAMTSPLLDFSFKRALYEHRDHPALRARVQEYAPDELEKEKIWRIAGKFTFGEGEQATLESIALDRTRRSRTVVVPELANNYAILAPKQSEDCLGTIAQTPENLVPLLTELFGRDYVRVIPAIQYFTKRIGDCSLGPLYLWTPSLNSRIQPERALVLGRSAGGDRFYVGADGRIGSRPAFGWRPAKNFS